MACGLADVGDASLSGARAEIMTAVDVCTISKWQVGQGQVHWRRRAGRACDDAGHADQAPALAIPAVPAIKDLRFTLRLYRTPQGLRFSLRRALGNRPIALL